MGVGPPAPRAPVRAAWATFALALGGFAIGTTEFASMSLLPQFARGLGVGQPEASHAISAYALGVVVGAPTIAIAAARMERRRLLVGLMLAYAAANLMTAAAPSFSAFTALRFVCGLPHGAYFGVASLVAASLVAPERRAQAVSRLLLGLTVATIAGVPLANVVGRAAGWRWGFGLVGVAPLVSAALIAAFCPTVRPDGDASPLRELGALKRPQVWLALATGAVGFGGLFCVYTFLAPTLASVTHAPPWATPAALAVFGLGLTAGNLAWAWAADRALMRAVAGSLAFSAAALALYAPAAGALPTLLGAVFLIGAGGGLAVALQTRLMDVAGDAQALAAALNHSAFNTANALGPWLGALAVSGGWGLRSTGGVGATLALAGLGIWAVSWTLDARRSRA